MAYEDISNYTDEELYEILDLDSPSDGVLESRIIQEINKYKDSTNENDKLLASFFSSVYDHFFDANVMGDVVDDEVYGDGDEDDELIEYTGPVADDNAVEKNETLVSGQQNIELSKPVTVASGTLNPVLQQTVKRIMSIDSQYRDTNYPLSTDFTFNLSEPLKDVLALRLYSISIPYTWYTVNNNFGSNFILLKGNVAGINNGDYDYKFEIGAGNYTQQNMIDAINKKIDIIKANNTDVSFGATQISYNIDNSKATFEIDIEKNYNELSYYVYFPTWTSPNDPTPNDPTNPGKRFQSIPGFLGFNFDTYYINSIRSTRFSPINDDIQRFTIEDTNKTFNIIVYQGPNEYSSESTIQYTINVTLDLENTNNIEYSRNRLIAAINDALNNNSNLTGESRFYKTTIDNVDVIDDGSSFFTLSIFLNRSNVYLEPNSKVYIEFPDETSISDNTKRIWTGSSSCFRFASRSYEMNDITGETPVIKQEEEEIVVNRNLYIEIKCVNPYGYGNNSTNLIYDNSLNDYTIYIPNSDVNGYTLEQFVNAFNDGLSTTIDNNPNGEINSSNSGFSLTNDSKVEFKMDILKTFNDNDYHGDISNSTYGQSFLTKILNIAEGSTQDYIDGSFVDLGTTNTFSAVFPTNNQYVIDTSFVLAVYPTSVGNNKADPYIVNIEDSLPIVLNQDVSYHSFPITLNNAIDEIPPLFNYLFKSFEDDDGDKVLSNCNLSVEIEEQSLLTATLTVIVEKYLDETDFTIQFFDPSLSAQQIDISNTYYVSDLEFNPDYVYDPIIPTPPINLSTIYQQSPGYSTDKLSLIPITVNQITLDETNNRFQLIPHESGVTSSNGENDITITIPPDTYNRTELIAEMNAQLLTNNLIQESYFNIIEDVLQNREYIRFHTNVLKQYTSEDFKLEFYSEETFTSCYATVSSVRSTTFDSTLGWLLGFRNRTTYELNDTTIENYLNNSSGVITIEGDSTVSVELYDKLFLVIDDYNQNRLNDGLITNVPTQEISTLPSYALRNSILCDPGSQTSRVSANEKVNYNRLTERQLFSINAINNEQANSSYNITANRKLNPYSKDTFAVIPIKVSSLQNGDLYTEFGGTLQNQERIYFGPVNIKRFTVRLMTDRGDPVDLNNADWNFSLVAEQLYQNQTQ